MKNTFSISQISSLLVKTHEKIESLTHDIASCEMEGKSEYVDVYSQMRLDELEHAQQLTLKLTELIVLDSEEINTENADEGEGSVFAEGELTDVKENEDSDCESEGK